jgi:regulator of protease activity HflC (stomatin/prohibitin superfamily)
MTDIKNNENKMVYEEKEAKYLPGMPCLLLNLLLIIASIAVFIWSAVRLESGEYGALTIVAMVFSALYAFLVGVIFLVGLKVLGPNEALVLTLFGKYYGTLREAGFYQVNPFVVSVNPAAGNAALGAQVGAPDTAVKLASGETAVNTAATAGKKKISLKAMTLNNDRQKINDQLGNPIIIGIVVIWRVVNTAKAVFNVDNYKVFLSIQCDSALRNIVRLYPYDVAVEPRTEENADEKSLRGSSDEVAQRLKAEIQSKVEIAGLEITEARITNLSYAPEIASAMLQRQQASAVVDARHMIVDGAVGMVEMALSRLSDSDIVNLDEERKAAMVSNLLVVLCGNRDAQPIVNSGSLY